MTDKYCAFCDSILVIPTNNIDRVTCSNCGIEWPIQMLSRMERNIPESLYKRAIAKQEYYARKSKRAH